MSVCGTLNNERERVSLLKHTWNMHQKLIKHVEHAPKTDLGSKEDVDLKTILKSF